MEEYSGAFHAGAQILNSSNTWNGTPIAITFSVILIGFCLIVLWYLFRVNDKFSEAATRLSESNFALKNAIETLSKATERILGDVGDIDKKIEKLINLHEKTHAMIRNLKDKST